MIRWMFAALLLLPLAGVGAMAQEFPNKVIRIVAGVTPGGGIDSAARILANELARTSGQNVIVENRSGAGGNIGADFVAKAEPDGHTVYITAPGAAVINHHLQKDMPYRYEDLAPVTLIGLVPLVVIVPAQRPLRTLADLVASAKAHPGRLNYGTPGIGTSNHMATVLFEQASGITLTHVPYRGPEANSDLIAGTLDLIFDAITTASPFIAGGKVRPLAVTTTRRLPQLPDVPTIAEQGYPDFNSTNWYGILAPARTPPAVIDRLNALFVAAAQAPEVKSKLEKLGLIVVASSPAEFKRFADEQYQRMGDAIRRSGIKAE